MVKSDVLTLSRILFYLNSIKMVSEVQTKRVRELFSQGKFICPEEFKDIFISNYQESDGKEQFKDLWLYSDNYVVEVLNFSELENAKLDITIVNRNIIDVTIEAKNYDFSQEAKNDSKLHIEFFTGIFSCDQIAYGINCDNLMEIFKKYIKNNIVRGRMIEG